MPDSRIAPFSPNVRGCPPEVESTVSWALAFGSRSRSSRIARTTASASGCSRAIRTLIASGRSVSETASRIPSRTWPTTRATCSASSSPPIPGSSRTSAGCASVPSAPAFEISAASRARVMGPMPPIPACISGTSIPIRSDSGVESIAGGLDYPASRPSSARRSSRSWNFLIFVPDIGQSVTKRTWRGTLKLAIVPRQ